MFSVNKNLVHDVGWFTFYGINKGNSRRVGQDCVSVCVRERVVEQILPHIVLVCTDLSNLFDSTAIEARHARNLCICVCICTYACMCVCACTPQCVFGWRALMSNISCCKSWDNFMWFDLWGPEKADCLSPVLFLRSDFLYLQSYLDSFLFIASHLFSGRRGREACSTRKKKKNPQTSCQNIDLLTRTAMKNLPFLAFWGCGGWGSSFYFLSWVSFAKRLRPVTCLRERDISFFSLFLLSFSCFFRAKRWQL